MPHPILHVVHFVRIYGVGSEWEELDEASGSETERVGARRRIFLPCSVCGSIHDGDEIDASIKPVPMDPLLVRHYTEAVVKHMRRDNW